MVYTTGTYHIPILGAFGKAETNGSQVVHRSLVWPPTPSQAEPPLETGQGHAHAHPKAPWALKGFPYPYFGAYVCALKLRGAFRPEGQDTIRLKPHRAKRQHFGLCPNIRGLKNTILMDFGTQFSSLLAMIYLGPLSKRQGDASDVSGPWL